ARGMQGVEMIIINPYAFICRIEPFIQPRILCSHANRASAAVAHQGLNTSERHHKTACAVTGGSTERQGFEDIETRDDLSCGDDMDFIIQVMLYQGFFH